MKNRLFPAIIFSTLIGASLIYAASFTDIAGNKYKTAIEYIQSKNIVQGYNDGSFKPDSTINRAELTKIILEANGIDTSANLSSCFPDVTTDWYAKYVCKAKNLGIISGYADGTFKPANEVNFVEALKIIEIAYGVKITPTNIWYENYVNEASSKNMIPLDITAFDQEITRGQMADIITRYLKYKDGTQAAYLTAAFGAAGDKTITYQDIAGTDAYDDSTTTDTTDYASPAVATGTSDPFPGSIILGRTTNNAITANIVSAQNLNLYIEYGTTKDSYTNKTTNITLTANQPKEIQINTLQADSQYYYRLRFSTSSSTAFSASDEYAFHTQRATDSDFSFAIQADPHMDEQSSADVYEATLSQILEDGNDFLVDLGDTFMTDKLPEKTETNILNRYLLMRDYFSQITHSIPLYLVLGNHEGEAGWDYADNRSNIAVLSHSNRLSYYPNPFPDGFFTGNVDKNDGNFEEDYYSFKWGNSLFIMLDPYLYTTTKPGSNGWDWTLGKTQYDWLKATLSNSDSKYKFIFLHQLVGGDNQGRGGIEIANLYEWGGDNADGSYGFDLNRPGWRSPIHQLLVDNNVDVVFKGHDHFYAKQELDGVIYQTLPQPSHPGDNINTAEQYGYLSGTVIGGSGYLKVNISPTTATVEFIKSDGTLADSYSI